MKPYCHARNVEGWTPDHDDEHDLGEMALAAACYATPERYRRMREHHSELPHDWPGGHGGVGWAPGWWKPSPDNRVRELAKAGALIAAEIDRLLRHKP